MNKINIEKRIEKYKKSPFPVAKYLLFCKGLVKLGLEVRLYEARKTNSKYVYAIKDEKVFKVRFSDHKPNRLKEISNSPDCDFFVGRTHTGVRHTGHAMKAVKEFFEL